MREFVAHLEWWIKAYCLGLLGLFTGFLLAMLWQLWRASRAARKSVRLFRSCPDSDPTEKRYGRSAEAVEVIESAAKDLPRVASVWWSSVEAAIQPYASSDYVAGQRKEGTFVTTPVEDLISLAQVAPSYSFSLFHTVPGLLTSLGLLGTFVALLLGLLGLKMNGQTVAGIDGLISNLSGKFATSITALSLSVVFLLIELWVQFRLRTVRARIVSQLDRLLPYLSPARVMLDIQRESVNQSTALRNISSDVVVQFANVFRNDLSSVFATHISGSMATQLQTELGPTLSDLRATMLSLTDTVARLETSKQESVLGQIKGLTDSLERTMKESLAQMGREFRDALTGSTQDEFGQLADVVKGSASMLGDMNAGFVAMQTALQTIVNEARSSTSTQIEAGLEQTKRLNALVEGLMTRLGETAAQNSEQVATVLTQVVADLSGRVEALSSDLMQRVGSLTAETQRMTSDTLAQAGAWSSQTSEQINHLLTTLQSKAVDFEKAGRVLEAAQNALSATLAQNNRALESLGAAAGQVRAYTEGLAGLQITIGKGQEAQTQMAMLAGNSVAKLAEAAGRHDEFLKRYKDTFEQYRGVFSGLDSELASVLTTIVERLQAYNQTVEENFRSMADSANRLMPQMAGAIKTATEDLGEQIEELSDVLEKGTKGIAAVTGAARVGEGQP